MKTINNESFSYTLPLTTIVSDLKRMLRDSTTIDIPRQRLIFRGRVLQDHLLLTDYSIVCGNVLHMVARPTADAELIDDAARNAVQSAVNHPAAASSYGTSQFSTEAGNLQGNQSVAEGNQLQQLARNELELLDQLLSGQPQGQQEVDTALHSQHQHDLQRQQLFSSDISSYSFQSSSRFAVLPSSTSAGAPSSSSLASTAFSPTTSTSPRPHVNSSSDSIERIRQGLLTIETIISTFDVDTTASNLQPIAIRIPLTVTTTASNTETSAAAAAAAASASASASGKGIRHSAVSPANNTETPLSGTNCVTDGSGSKVNYDAPLSISDSRNSTSIGLKGSEVFEKAAGVGLLNSNSNSSTHSSGSDSQREIETHTMNKEELESSNLEEDAVDASNELVITHLSEDSPSRGTGVGAGTLKGAASEPGLEHLREETPGRYRERQRQRERDSGREIKRQYFVGQWVDVKDTVSQWLEATVMMIDEPGQRVFIHYNGW